MAEATHSDIISRVAAVENRLVSIGSDLAVVQVESKRASLGMEENRAHFEAQILRLSEKQGSTHIMLEKHRSEVQTGVRVILVVMTLGLSALGLLISYQA